MKYLEIETIIKNTISSAIDKEGWANLAKVGILLRQNGVRYGKLSKMLQNFTHIIETRKDESLQPPVIYIKLK